MLDPQRKLPKLARGLRRELGVHLNCIRWAIALVWRSSPGLFALTALANLVQGLGAAVMIWISRYVLDAIVTAVRSGGAASDISKAMRVLGLQFLVITGLALIGRINLAVRSYLGGKMTLTMTSDILLKISRLELAHFEDPRTYDMLNRAMAEAGSKPLGLVDRISEAIRTGLTFVSLGWLLAGFSLPLLLLLVALCLPYLCVQVRYGKIYYQMLYQRTHNQRMSNYLSELLTSRPAIPEIKSFGLWPFLFEKWLGYSKSFLAQDRQLLRRRTGMETAIELLLSAGRVFATGAVVYLGLKRMPQLSVGEIMMYSGAFAGGLAALGSGMDSLSGLYQGSLFLQNLIEFNRLKDDWNDSQAGRPAPEQIESIALENLSFRYPGREEYALEGINITFRRAQSVLIVGANGSGKTTMMKLIARLYEPSAGRILLNGTDIREYNLESYRAKIGVLFQEFSHFALTVRENIGCGCIAALHDEERIVKAAQFAKADAFINGLPLRYHTLLNKGFKEGQELSLGQWQRIAIARLFMKDPPVLIFDEPSASLDVEAEAHFLREISQLAQERICLLVSHRMIRRGIADRIVLLERGKIWEQGTFEELLANKGKYSQLWTLAAPSPTGFAP